MVALIFQTYKIIRTTCKPLEYWKPKGAKLIFLPWYKKGLVRQKLNYFTNEVQNQQGFVERESAQLGRNPTFLFVTRENEWGFS